MSANPNILIVDDDLNSLQMLEQSLKIKNYEVTACLTSRDAMREMEPGKFSAAVLDYFMPDTTGLEMMKEIHMIDPLLPVLILTASRDIKLAIETIKEGAFHYLGKPVNPDELFVNLNNAMANRNLMVENQRLKLDLKQKHGFDQIIGSAGCMKDVFDMTARAAKVRSTVLITGETGVGKELIAKAMHYNSARAEKPFIRVNCSAIPETLLEAELFGIEKNVASGVDQRMGKFEAADGGSIFLDEIGDMAITTQAKVLRVIQEREIERVGSHTPRKVDIRIIAATNLDLETAIEKKEFRRDLYFRLNVIVIPLPALRKRKEDIPSLVDHFLVKFCAENNLKLKTVAPEAMAILMAYAWPGNVRELENTIERMVVMNDDEALGANSVPVNIGASHETGSSLPDGLVSDLDSTVNDFERGIILGALERNAYRQNRAADELGISERSMWYKIKKLGISVKKGPVEH
ncbi:Nitrogen regulation protein NR(I) [hydrothermal vent metagenome]|uniref:Nitrogen regulation protein NR(I) n=1 Tax=hydrothermal vent metagenome TaxID=652676 RepID=A0A3B1CU77_9ZZZZ